ncbi:MAG: hypothetical protein QM739_02840 [Propionivibrio sp.]
MAEIDSVSRAVALFVSDRRATVSTCCAMACALVGRCAGLSEHC